MSKFFKISMLFLVIQLTACSLTGYGGTAQFRCTNNSDNHDPLCESISQNYQDSVAGVLGHNGQRVSDNLYSERETKTLMQTETLYSGTPLRTQTETARIWIAPYLDSDGDLVDQSYTYITLNQGRWLLGHNQQQIIEAHRPVRLLGGGTNRQPETSQTSESLLDDVKKKANNLIENNPLQNKDYVPNVGGDIIFTPDN